MLDDALAWILSLALLAGMALLASMALRAGESAGHQSIARPAWPSATEAGAAVAGRSRAGVVNQVLVWGLALTLLGATIALVIASFWFDSFA